LICLQSHGGANVYLTGDFNGWSGKIPMHRSHNDFTLILDMPPGKYHYKFIVDNSWYACRQPLE
jgi:5'-AMP-activated protein kinase regulatory beta subunit